MKDAEAAITELVYRYCELIDTGDFAGFAALFEHGIWFMTKDKGSGSAPVRAWLDDNIILYDGLPNTKHVTTNLTVDADEAAGAATARSYINILQAVPGFPLQVIFSGRYQDSFERVGGVWRWRERACTSDLFGDMSRHIRHPPPIGPAPRIA